MLEIRKAPLARWILACAVLLGIAASVAPAFAQMNPGAAPPPPQQQQGAQTNPICIRLEGQLAAMDRGAGTGDPAKDEQIRRYQEAQAKQQGELDRVTQQAKRMGCESSGFFSLFNGQSAQCTPVNNQIQQMRANLEQITTSLERLRSGGIGGADRENQRRSVLTALAQNNCGPQYAAAARGPGIPPVRPRQWVRTTPTRAKHTSIPTIQARPRLTSSASTSSASSTPGSTASSDSVGPTGLG